MSKKFFITTPIYYINAKPHLGHAYTTLAADVLSRHYRQKGGDVFFLTGTDEHGAKVAEAAKQAGQDPARFADKISASFANLSKTLNFSNDAFIRTTDPRHQKIVQEYLQELRQRGFIYKKKYSGLYCVACEKFLTKKELIDGLCPDHKRAPVTQSEENWFFKLSAFQDKIKRLVESDELKIRPRTRRNEILGKIDLGLEDISISREGVSWGIPVPWDKSQTIYVWIDALLNYWSAPAIFRPSLAKSAKASLWPPDLHIIGRDIAWFHAVIWPALLLAAGKQLPREIFIHGYFTIDGEKMSKSIGNTIDPAGLAQKWGVDSVRYYLLREFPFGEDGDVSGERLRERYNSDLAAGLGNLVQRVLTMAEKAKYEVRRAQTTTQQKDKKGQDKTQGRGAPERVGKLTESLKFQEALAEIWKEIAAANREIAQAEPWKLLKEGGEDKLEELLGKWLNKISKIASLASPYLPETAEDIEKQIRTLTPRALFSRK